MTTLALVHPVARKAHRCDSCQRPIPAGEQYRRWTGTDDMWTGPATCKECIDCCRRYGRDLSPFSTSRPTGSDAPPVCPDCEGTGLGPYDEMHEAGFGHSPRSCRTCDRTGVVPNPTGGER